MVIQEKIVDWLHKHKNHFSIKVQNNTWPKEFELNGFYDYSVQMTFSSHTYWGQGFNNNEQLAFIIAVVECLERIIIKFNGLKNSNGVAVHTARNLAIENATNELIERDSFFCHYLTNSPFCEIKRPLPRMSNTQLPEIYIFLKKQQLNINHFKMNLFAKNKHSVLTIVCGNNLEKPFGLCLGSSVNKSLYEAILKSTKESLVQAMRQIITPRTPLTLEDLKNTNSLTISDHARLGYNTNYAKKFEITFCEDQQTEFSSNNLINPEILIKTLKVPKEIDLLNLHFVQASSSALQSLFFGKISDEQINFKRLKIFDSNFKFSELNNIPHPYA